VLAGPDEPLIVVRDVLGWAPGLRLVGAETGLDRPVRWAQATDLPDPSPYLRGSELVLVTGLSMVDAAACRAFVAALAPTRPAAIGYAIGVVHASAPPVLVREANRRGIPVFEIPTDVPFIHFTEQLSRERMAHQERSQNGHLVELVRLGRAGPEVLLQRAPGLDGDHRALQVSVHARGSAPGPAVSASGRTLVADLGDRIVVLHRAGEPPPAAAGPAEGTSGPGRPSDLPRLLAQAVAAFDLARSRGRPATAADLASLDSLARCLPAAYLQPFHEHLWEPLARHDRVHGTELLATVRTLVACAGSVRECGRRMYLHPNSVRKRIGRIRAVTGRDPADPADLAALTVALTYAEGPAARA